MHVNGPGHHEACYLSACTLDGVRSTFSSLGFFMVSWQVSQEKETILAEDGRVG